MLAERESRRVTEAAWRSRMSPLQPFLPRLVLGWDATAPGALVREIEGSMVFVDVSGFTKMSERLARQGKVGAEEVSDVIGDTFGALLAESYACGGSLIKFGGDALLLFFDGDDHANRAVAAAHGMRAELRTVGRFTTTAGKVTLRMSVGAHTGVFHFFLVGGSHRELIVAGPAATETVTMEGAASAGQILLSPALAGALPRANRGRPLGPGVLLAGTPPEVERVEIDRQQAEIDLQPFVPVALRETILAGEVEPEHRSVTIAFLHYGGFDELLRREGSEAAAAALDALVRSTQQAADANGVAFLASDIAPDGGKLILTAGAPVVTGADEEQMLLAVRAIATSGSALPLEIGVNKGPVFAGSIGPAYRQTYTVMGDAVNLAARLMAKAEHGEIVATPEVLDASRTIFEATELEPFLVKGKKKPITAFVVGEAKGSRTTIAEAGLPLLGRDEELAALLDAWEAAQRGEGRVVEITAEPGMGKSRLLDELLARIEGARVIHGECRLYQAATPYFPFRAPLRAAFGLEGLGHDEAVAALTRLVDERAPSLRPWLSLIATPLDLDVAPSPEVEALEDEFRRTRLEEAVASLLAVIAARPIVAVVEDTHWMDEPSRDLLARVTDALRAKPCLFVLTRRPGEAGYVADDESGSLVRIELQPLGPEPVIALIHAATEDAPLMPQQERELAERAAGNPLFLIELLDALRRGDDVESMPSSVEGLIQARIDTLPTVDRRRLRALSVLGNGFRVEHATATLDTADVRDVRRVIRPLGEFLSVDGTGWVQFRHALIRDAAYEGLPYRRRQQLHAQVGDSILLGAGDHPEEQAELLAVHYWHARRWEEAWRFSRVAGDQAREIYANVEAGRFYERALSSAQRLAGAVHDDVLASVWRALGVVREAAGEFEKAHDALCVATRLLRDDPAACADTYYLRAQSRYRLSAYRLALRETAAGLKLVESAGERDGREARARLQAYRADVLLQQGRARGAIVLAESARTEAERVGEKRALALAYSVLDAAYQQVGEPEKAVHGRSAVELFRELGDTRRAAMEEMNIAVQDYAEGRWDEAVNGYTRAYAELERIGDTAHAAYAQMNLGEVLVSRGALDEAETVLVEARRALRSLRMTAAAVFAGIQLGRLAIARGQLADAVSTLTALRDEASSIGYAFLAVESAIHLASAHVTSGRPAEALAVLGDAERVAGDEAMSLAVPIGRVRAQALLELGRRDEAETTVRASLGLAQQQGLLYEEALLLRLLAEVGNGSDPSAVQKTVEDADRILHRLGAASRRP